MSLGTIQTLWKFGILEKMVKAKGQKNFGKP